MRRYGGEHVIPQKKQFREQSDLAFDGKRAGAMPPHENLPLPQPRQKSANNVILLGAAADILNDVIDENTEHVAVPAVREEQAKPYLSTRTGHHGFGHHLK